jgi:hypothetical protein
MYFAAALPIDAKDRNPKIRAPIDGNAIHNGLFVVGIIPLFISTTIIMHAAVSAVVCHPLAFRISSHRGSAGFIDIE